MQAYQEQYEKLLRQYKEIKSLLANSYATKDSIINFCITSHHLRDFIANDQTAGISWGEVENFVKSNRYLQLNGDIANLSKHFSLNHPSKVGGNLTCNTCLTYDKDIGSFGEFDIVDNIGNRYGLSDFINNVVQSWESFLRLHSLL